MFTVVIIDTEANWDDPKPKCVLDVRFDTQAEAHTFAQDWLDRMEMAIPDFVQVFTYEVRPLRDPDKAFDAFLSFITLFTRADYREGSALE